MRYRKLDENGDYIIGRGPSEFWVNTPAGVAQAIRTALNLFQGEWLLDVTVGMPWFQSVIGYGTQSLYDAAFKATILGVEGVLSIESYSSSLNPATRELTIGVGDSPVIVNTIYGQVTISNETILLGGYGISPYGGPTPYGGG